MPHPGRMTTQKAKDFKGTMRSLLAELGHYKFRLIAVIVFAVLSTIFNIAGPKVLAKATTALATGWVAKLRGTGSIRQNPADPAGHVSGFRCVQFLPELDHERAFAEDVL